MQRSKAGLILVLSSLVLVGCSGSGGASSSSASSSESKASETSSSSVIQSESSSSSQQETSSSSETSSYSSSSSQESSSTESSSSSESISYQSSESSSSEESSSEESSSLEEVAHSITTKTSGYSVVFSKGATSYKAGEEVSFTLSSLGAYYSLKSVYYVEKGTNYPRVSLEPNDEGVYSFLMPGFDITLNVESDRLYSVSFSGNHFTYKIEEEQAYYKSGKTINFSIAIEEGYMLSGSISGTYLSVSSEDSGTKSVGIKDGASEGSYYFYMPEGNVTISVPTEAKPVVSEDDPFTKAVTYVGTYSYTPTTDYTTYTSTITISFSGDGMLTWGVTYYYETDDWGDWDYKDFNPFTGYVRLEKSAVSTLISTTTKKYKFDASTNILTFSAPGRVEDRGDVEWKLDVSTERNSDGLPEKLIFTQVVDSSVPQGMGSKNTELKIA